MTLGGTTAIQITDERVETLSRISMSTTSHTQETAPYNPMPQRSFNKFDSASINAAKNKRYKNWSLNVI